MAKEIITLSGIMPFLKDDLNSVTESKLKYKAGFVLELKIAEFVIKAKVRASMKDKSYQISLLMEMVSLVRGKANALRENGYAATWQLHQFMQGLSNTDLPNSWKARPNKSCKIGYKAI